MAFANGMRQGEERKTATGTLPVDKSRSFSAFAQDSTPEGKSNANSLSINYGNGTTDWGPNSIWGNGTFGNGLSKTATRDNSRDGSRHAGQDEQAKAMRSAASLSVDDPWRREWKPSGDRTMPSVEQGSGFGVSQYRSASHTTLPSSSSSTVGSRPPAISLNTSSIGAGAEPRSAASNTMAARGYEAAPTVYTKHDRQQESKYRSYRDSATAGSWGSMSPTETRRPFPPTSRTVSQPMSRSGSQQHAASGDERPTFSRPDYNRGQQRSTQNSSRAPSLSSQGMTHYNSSGNPSLDQLPMQFGQLSTNSDSRTQTSYKSSDASFSHLWSAGVSPLSRTSTHGATADFAGEDLDEYDGEIQRYTGFSHSLSPLSTNLPTQSFGGRFPPTPTSNDFRPDQAYTNGHLATYGPGMPSEHKSIPKWQSLSNSMGQMQISRRSPSTVDQQTYMMPQMQQLFAAQLRQHYEPMFNPYAMPNPMHLNGFNPYLSMMPVSFPQIEPGIPVQKVEAGESIQSALLFEFKNQSKSKRYELRDIYEHVAEFSGDQHGSRFIQTKLETANSDEKSKVFDEISPNAIQLMTDVFGNYVIQKFFEHGDQMHKKILAAKMKGQVLALTNQMYGCRVVQKALDHVLVDQQAQLIRELEGHVLRCVKDQNGNHVIQKAIERCPSSIIGFIVNSFQGSVQQLSVNSYGCRVIQRCLEYCDKPAKSIIMAELMDGIQGMITDQYGNYVVQHVVEKDDGEGSRNVLNIVMKNLELYSKHKFASNVVEKCLEWGDDGWRHAVVMQLASDDRRGPDGDSVLVGMIKDSYGNYVIQKLLDTINPTEFFIFLDSLQPAVSQAKRTGCGKQIQSVERKMERFSRTRHILPSQGFHPPTGPAASFNTPPSYQFGLPASHAQFVAGTLGSSTGTTPPDLTAGQSLQSSGFQSLNEDAVEGAHAHAHGHGGMEGYVR